MVPLADMHCHLLAGLDDGPRTWDDALAMCRGAYEEGVRLAAATAHQNERWRAVTPERIVAACAELRRRLGEAGVPLEVFPCAEVTAHVGLAESWQRGLLLGVSGRRHYLLVELPHGPAVELGPTVKRLQEAGPRPILAHPERHPELLDEPGALERLIGLGCLVQVNAGSVTDPPSRAAARALRDWFRRGCVHLLGSDGHSPTRRPPRLAGAYRQVRAWAGAATADRVCSTNGMAVLHALPLRVEGPRPRRRWWPPSLW